MLNLNFVFLKIKSDVSGNQPYADSHSRSTSSIHSTTTTLNDIEHRTNKRRRDHMSDTDTSGDEEIQEVNTIIDFIDRFLFAK